MIGSRPAAMRTAVRPIMVLLNAPRLRAICRSGARATCRGRRESGDDLSVTPPATDLAAVVRAVDAPIPVGAVCAGAAPVRLLSACWRRGCGRTGRRDVVHGPCGRWDAASDSGSSTKVLVSVYGSPVTS
jgi:hypothetical protein